MKFAIISDVHGNLPALNTVIEDAEKRNIDGLIFVGDYCLNSPWPDECITRIRQLDNAYVIRGNEERYLENLVGKDPNTWLDGQMQISYWVYQKLSSENLNYLLSLPTNMSFSCHDVSVNMAHSSADFIGACELKEWRTLAELFIERFAKQYDKGPLALSEGAKQKLKEHPWYGNIRELEHAIEKVVIICDGATISDAVFHFPKKSLSPTRDSEAETLEDMELVMIRKAIDKHEGNLSAVASQLGITRQTLYNKMKKYGL